MMEVKDLTARTRKGKLLLDHVSFALEPGGCTGLTGASGSGKTTLLKALLGFRTQMLRSAEGSFFWTGRTCFNRRRKCGGSSAAQH